MVAARRPNVLFLIADQLRADHVGFAGRQTANAGVLQTPNLDALAARGTVFDDAWVSNPVCMPNRSTIMTGRMPSAHGVIFNDRSLDWGANTHVRRFRAAGYRTALIGKSHLQHGMSRNTVVSAAEQGAVADPWVPGWDTLEHAERYERDLPEWPDDFYGFGHVELTIDHGARVSGHHLHWALDRGGRWEDLVVPLTAESPFNKRSDRWWQIYEPPYSEDLHSSTFVADRTVAFIEDAAAAGDPWLVWASFPDPHHPIAPPAPWFDRHHPADIELPPTVDDPLDGATRYIRRVAVNHPSTQQFWVQPCGVAGDHQLLREAIAATFGMIELIDDRVGQILAAVERLDQTRDTIVVFTSDHGDMMGDHGLMLKGSMHFRGTLQVPMVIVDPTRTPGRSSSLASSIDLGPTLLDLAGLAGYDGIQGRSLVPVLDDKQAVVRDHVLVEDDMPHALVAERSAVVSAKNRTILADGMKYTRHSTGEEQLFDLVADPDETDPIGHRDPARRGAMVERLMDALIQADDDARGAPVG